MNSSSACSRETSGSQPSGTSASERRPIVTEPAALVQPDDQLRAAVVAEQQERIPALLRLAAGVEIVGRGEVEGERRVHQREKMFSSETKMFTTETKMPVASQTASASVPCLRM